MVTHQLAQNAQVGHILKMELVLVLIVKQELIQNILLALLIVLNVQQEVIQKLSHLVVHLVQVEHIL